MNILFIRHGQTTGDVENRYGGDYDDHLSEEGKKQLALFLKSMKSRKIDLVVSSPLLRAIESAAPLAEQAGCQMTTEDDFRERNQYGILTGMVKEEAKEKYPFLVEKLRDRLNTIDGAESYEDFRIRITAALDRLISDKEHSDVAIVWHGGPMRVLFRDILQKGEIDGDIKDYGWAEIETGADGLKIRSLSGLNLSSR